jgi:DNA-binding Xre family transcriptional regulator/quercetin dioxygenase-like cupin family protein
MPLNNALVFYSTKQMVRQEFQPEKPCETGAMSVPAPASTGMDEVGPKLRALRQSKSISVTDLAGKAGITKGFLSLAERGKTRVSVPTLLRICDALGVTIGSLFNYPSEPVVHGGVPVYMGGNDLQEFLLTPVAEMQFQVMRSSMQPGGGSQGAYSLDADSIFVLVLHGRLSLEVGGKTIILDAGDSTTFSAREKHNWHNPLKVESQVLWVIAPALPLVKSQNL